MRIVHEASGQFGEKLAPFVVLNGGAPYLMKATYLVAQGYANVSKTVWMTIIHISRLRNRQETFSKIITVFQPLLHGRGP